MAELPRALTDAGFQDVEIVEQFDCFRGTSKENVARKYGVIGVNVTATKR